MKEQQGVIAVGKERLHYIKWGSGKRLLLAFHGYSASAWMFSLLAKYLENDYTIFSFDLPHHGSSPWGEGSRLTAVDLAAMAQQLMQENGRDKVSLAGYSIGGRVCLALMGQIPGQTDRITLLATDGLRVDPYFYFFTSTAMGRKVFRNLLEKPGSYLQAINLINNIKLVNLSRYKFATHFLQSAASRQLLLKVWPAMSGLMPQPSQLKETIKRYRIPVTIFMGAYDKIMPPSIAEKFRKGLDTVQLYVLSKGHRVLDNETAQQIANSLL
jgi:pimeloyl-ACP methyl ester carboxylesterase